MSMVIDGAEVIEVIYDFGVSWEGLRDNIVCETEAEARNLAADTGGALIVQTTYITDWCTIESEDES
jgi:hypothetical protein